MPAPVAEVAERAAHKSLHFFQELFGEYHPRNFAVEFWDGTIWAAEPGQPTRFTWRIQHPAALRAMFWPPSLVALGEAYIYGDFDIEGGLEAAFPIADYLLNKDWGQAQRLRLGALLLELPAGEPPHAGRPGAKLRGPLHSKDRDRQAVTYHYDVSNDFYALWLGPPMVYSCAYFATPEDDLDTAQERKLDYICRKLRLRPGERLLDIGCGWGGLVMHAARQYGVQALGITLSRPQAQLAQERIRQAGLEHRCRVEVLDYREVNGSFDKLASIGMVEHVGQAMLPEYFRRAFRLLRPGGVFLNHGIGRPANLPAPARPTFSDLYVFPDGELLPITTTLQAAEEAGFEVRDVENLREHYALTLRHWLRAMEAQAEEARRFTNEVTYRIWRLHMAGSAYYFHTGRLDLYQTLLVKPDQGASGLPLTRADWYRTD